MAPRIFEPGGSLPRPLVLLLPPAWKQGRLYKGVVLLSDCDVLCRLVPPLKRYFYLVERHGWAGMNPARTADVKLVDDLATLDETRRLFPRAIALGYASGDFVDSHAFRPLDARREYSAIQVAAWQPFKRHALFVEAAARLASRRFIMFGHFWRNGKDPAEIRLRAETISLAGRRNAQVDFPFREAASNEQLPRSASEINALLNRATMGIVTSTTEGLNRFKMECLAADLPVLVPKDAAAPVRRYITQETGVLYEPTPEGLADAIVWVEHHRERFSPRAHLLARSGIERAQAALREALTAVARAEGVERDFASVRWDGRNSSFSLWGTRRQLAQYLWKVIMKTELARVGARRGGA